MMYDRVHRKGPLTLSYVANFATQSDRPLLVVFPSVNTQPGLCLASYFYYQGVPEADVIHIIDNIGSFGSYFLTEFAFGDALSLLTSALKPYVDQAKAYGKKVAFCGTSKGGTIALLAATAFSGVECIIGEPQIMLGNFLIGKEGFNNEAARAIAYVLTARTDPADKDLLNRLILDRLRPALAGWENPVTCIVGEKSGYDYWHIRHLVAELEHFPAAKPFFNISMRDFNHHNDVIEHFVEEMRLHGFAKPV